MSEMTVREAMQKASRFFESYQMTDAPFLAEYCIRYALGWDRTTFVTRLQDPLPPGAWEGIENIIRRRAMGEPLQYITGEQEFYGLSFWVNPSVLIPRPETELLVEEALRRIPELGLGDTPLTVADIGTGSGAIIISLAVHGSPQWHYVTVDISPGALDTARYNAKQHQVEDRITFYQGDLFTPLLETQTKVHVLLSNPPYIPSEDIHDLDPQVKDHEPCTALDGGDDGLDFYRLMVEQLPLILANQALVGFEVGMGQDKEVKDLLESTGLFQEVYVINDYAGIGRHVLALRKA